MDLMSVPHTYSAIGAIMNSMGGGGGGGGAQIVSVVPDDFTLTEGNQTVVSVTTSGFPDGTTELSWEVRNSSNQVASADWSVASGTVDINAGAISSSYQDIDGATVSIFESDPIYNLYTFQFFGTLAGAEGTEGLGYSPNYPPITNYKLGLTNYYLGTATGSTDSDGNDLYTVREFVQAGGNGTASFIIQSNNDSVTEGDEEFTIRCSATVDSTSVTQSSSPITVSDPSGLQDFRNGIAIARWFQFPGQTDRTASDIAIKLRSDAESTAGETVIARAECRIKIKAVFYNPAPGEGGEARKQLQVFGNAVRADTTAFWYNNSQNIPQPLSVSAGDSGDQVLYGNISSSEPSHVKLIYGRYGNTARTDTGWVATPNAEDGIQVTLVGQAEADVAADEFDSGKYVVECWAKEEGLYAPTRVVTFIITCEAYAAGQRSVL